jgi:hypothetical protein
MLYKSSAPEVTTSAFTEFNSAGTFKIVAFIF